MPIKRKSRRYMTPLARRVAVLHNEAYSLSRKLKALAQDVQRIEDTLREAARSLYKGEKDAS